ncbi:MAG: glutamine-hydrolyzing GMP synthase, partial [Rhabdochlamydiaceae bacterium]
MTEKILIIDFGSQYTQLIARKVRECNVYGEIHPCTKPIIPDDTVKGVILSGSPFSVNDQQAPKPDFKVFAKKIPVLGVCYGAQLIAQSLGGEVAKSLHREYGRAILKHQGLEPLLEAVSQNSQVWMSHADTIVHLPENCEVVATTDDIPVAAFKCKDNALRSVYGLQFHPEVYHSTEGLQILKNFLINICHCSQNWTPAAFVNQTVGDIKKQTGDQQMILALSGGVDSTVAATLIHNAIGKNLHGIFVD